MSELLDFGSINPFGSIGGMGGFASILLVIAISTLILLGISFLIFIFYIKKQYYIKIHLFRLVGNVPTRIAVHEAKEVPFGMAGDRLWLVAPAGIFKLKAIKWLSPGKIQSGANEFWYYIRDDGEWINFKMDDLNDVSRKAGVKFVQEDMRLQRLAIERLLEQRLLDQTFWEKWQTVIMTMMFFLVVAICMVIIFYQFSKIIEDMQSLTKILTRTIEVAQETKSGAGSLVPVD